MRALHFRRLWITCSVLLVLFSLIEFLKPFEDGLTDWFSFDYGDKLLHIIAFAMLAGWFATILERARWRSLGLCLLLYGILIEVLQYAMQMGRSADAWDVATDAAGIAIGFGFAALIGVRLLDAIDSGLRRAF